MPQDSFQEWLEGFRKEVDAVVAGVVPSTPAADDAKAAFENWWKTAQEPIASDAPTVEIEKLDEADRKVSELTVQLTDERATAASAREGLQLQNAKFETQVRALHEQVNSLKENRVFLEETARRAEAGKTAAEEELKIRRERELLASRELVSVKNKNEALAEELDKLRQAIAGAEGSLEELRRQASVYQERLVHAKELTDADVALLRQELKMFLEEFRVMMNTIRKG
jgi:chromosome segregation ATPase